MADLAGMSPPHLFAVTRKYYDRTPLEIVRNQRLALASQLLRFGTETLAAIAERTGYESAFSLSRAFKRAYGASPEQFRRTHADAPAGTTSSCSQKNNRKRDR
jgi:AraC-like DNA-binding protein